MPKFSYGVDPVECEEAIRGFCLLCDKLYASNIVGLYHSFVSKLESSD